MSGVPQVSVSSSRHLRLVPRQERHTTSTWKFVARGVFTVVALGGLMMVAAALLARPVHAQLDVRAAETAIKTGDARAARLAAEAALTANAADASAHYWLGRAAFLEERWGESVGHMEAATKADPKTALYFEWYGNALGNEARTASKVRQPFLAKRMKAAWETSLRLDPSSVDTRVSLIQFYVQAPGFMGGSKDKAYAMAEEIRGLNARRGHEELGKLYERDKRWADAERAYLAGAALQSERPFVRFRLGLMYANSGQIDKAFETYEALRTSHPDEIDALYAIGRTAATSGQRLERGAAALTDFLARPRRDGATSAAQAHFRLGQIRERQGQRDVARQELQEALRLEPRHKEASQALKKLG